MLKNIGDEQGLETKAERASAPEHILFVKQNRGRISSCRTGREGSPQGRPKLGRSHAVPPLG